MIELSWAYVGEPGAATPVEVACHHEGVPGVGWLLPVALAHGDQASLVSDALEVATASGVLVTDVAACVSYVTLAWELFRGATVEAAVASAIGEGLPASTSEPVLCGMALIDGLNAGIWALTQQARLGDIAASLAEITEPWVAAAAAGVLGVRDGCAGVPSQWFRRVAVATECAGLAARLAERPRAETPRRRCVAVAS